MNHLQDILGCFASPLRLAVLSALAGEPKNGEQVARRLDMGAAEVDEHLRQLIACGLVFAMDNRQGYSLRPSVELHENAGDLHIRIRTPDGTKVQAQLPMDSPTGRMLARSRGEARTDG